MCKIRKTKNVKLDENVNRQLRIAKTIEFLERQLFSCLAIWIMYTADVNADINIEYEKQSENCSLANHLVLCEYECTNVPVEKYHIYTNTQNMDTYMSILTHSHTKTTLAWNNTEHIIWDMKHTNSAIIYHHPFISISFIYIIKRENPSSRKENSV